MGLSAGTTTTHIGRSLRHREKIQVITNAINIGMELCNQTAIRTYLTGGEAKQNIDASRIEVRTGSAGTATSEQWIIPTGATFPNASSTMVVDESKVKAIPDHPKPAAKKKAKAMA